MDLHGFEFQLFGGHFVVRSFLCCYLAAGFKKMKRIKAFVNELMCDSSDAKWRQKVIGITFEFNSLHSLFLSERDGTQT